MAYNIKIIASKKNKGNIYISQTPSNRIDGVTLKKGESILLFANPRDLWVDCDIDGDEVSWQIK